MKAMKKKWQRFFWISGIFAVASVVGAKIDVTEIKAVDETMVQEAAEAYTTYDRELEIYTKENAQLERNSLIYGRAQNEENLNLVMESARATLTARAQALYNYSLYLGALCGEYMENQIELAGLREELLLEAEQFAALKNDFTQITDWYVQDDTFAKAMAKFQVTAYRAYAWIYWTRMSVLNENFTALIEAQKSRILAESETAVLRAEEEKIIEQAERAVTKVKKDLVTIKPNLNNVNSYDSYTNLAHNLDQIRSELKANLINYANLE